MRKQCKLLLFFFPHISLSQSHMTAVCPRNFENTITWEEFQHRLLTNANTLNKIQARRVREQHDRIKNRVQRETGQKIARASGLPDADAVEDSCENASLKRRIDQLEEHNATMLTLLETTRAELNAERQAARDAQAVIGRIYLQAFRVRNKAFEEHAITSIIRDVPIISSLPDPMPVPLNVAPLLLPATDTTALSSLELFEDSNSFNGSESSEFSCFSQKQ